MSLAVWDYVRVEFAKQECEIIRLREYTRQIIAERDEFRRLYLEQKHLYDEHINGKSEG